ncbi:MAG: cytochrome C [Betaproteobacteria bacterium]
MEPGSALPRSRSAHSLSDAERANNVKINRNRAFRIAAPVIGCALLAILLPLRAAADGERADNESRIQRGFEISPIPPSQLTLRKKNRALVGLGSYIVNTTGCNDCHTHPAYAPGGNPFLGQPEQINVGEYMAGGRTFPPSPFVAANITPDAIGKPAGLTFEQFRATIRTGHNPLDAPGLPLQIMPWPVFGKMTDGDLRAIYEYLSAIPSLPDNPIHSPEP